jgi:hypothetical protein
MRHVGRVFAAIALVAVSGTWVGADVAAAGTCTPANQAWVRLKTDLWWHHYVELYVSGSGGTPIITETYAEHVSDASEGQPPMRDVYTFNTCWNGGAYQIDPSSSRPSQVEAFYSGLDTQFNMPSGWAFGTVPRQINSDSLVVEPTLCRKGSSFEELVPILTLPIPEVHYLVQVAQYLAGVAISLYQPAANCYPLDSLTVPLTITASGASATNSTNLYYLDRPWSSAGPCAAPNTCRQIDEFVWKLVSDGAGSTYHPVTPTRVLDTRTGVGLSGQLKHNTLRTLQVTSDTGPVPTGAVAVTGNVTVVRPSAAGYVTVAPSITKLPPDTSTINLDAAGIRANGVTMELGSGGRLDLVYEAVAGASTDVVFDVTGYYTADSTGYMYHPIVQGRFLDTRTGVGLSGKFGHNTPRTLHVAGTGGVPAGAVAITGNVTVVSPSAAGYVTAAPSITKLPPDTSTINFESGQIRANNLTVPLTPSGDLSLVYEAGDGASTDILLDVTGYYLAGSSGYKYFPIAPVRALDTRSGTGLRDYFSSNTPRTLEVRSDSGAVPKSAVAITGNVTVPRPSASGYVTVAPSITKLPPDTSTINVVAGGIQANGLNVMLGSAGLAIVYEPTPNAYTHIVLDITGFFS